MFEQRLTYQYSHLIRGSAVFSEGPRNTLLYLHRLTSKPYIRPSYTVGPKFTRPACRTATAAVDRYLLCARARLRQETRRPPLLLSIDVTDGRTDIVDRFMTFTAKFHACNNLLCNVW